MIDYDMMLLALVLLSLGVSFIAYKNSFPLLKLGAGAAWIALFMYAKDNPPEPILEGSAIHTVLLLVFIVMALAVILSGLGRDVQRNRQSMFGNFTSNEFKWRFGKDKREYDGIELPHRESAEEYRAKVHKALRRK